ncbi:hypothetical protein M409DRAFT_25246 [Zasmidium cellare ATCC 36951]|uniref:Uncharacterized protein n=1 Tax=Zasmidium cellare ATCC 36951 TaxID=1080233 RepID=A0A6A6CAZ3_ZASCE|nr:uncharacterized protein M409DRAFT_25246 [Zasmidium cellare ATCC 36951]KAF2164367.1 hypothetical protein M409DRAFT_25246 [Zasmidium cellare ATCC 36951]
MTGLRILAIISAFLLSRSTFALPTTTQKPLQSDLLMATDRKRLPGSNDARYCGVPEEEQLFKIEEFSISPRPLATDTRLFAYLKGHVSEEISEDELKEAVLHINTTNSKGGLWPLEEKFAVFPQIVVRQDQQYSKLLKPGVNEVIGDIFFWSKLTPAATYKFKVEAHNSSVSLALASFLGSTLATNCTATIYSGNDCANGTSATFDAGISACHTLPDGAKIASAVFSNGCSSQTGEDFYFWSGSNCKGSNSYQALSSLTGREMCDSWWGAE